MPLTERALAWIERHLETVRPHLVREPDEGTLFLHKYGEPFYRNRLGDLVKRYLAAARVDKPLRPREDPTRLAAAEQHGTVSQADAEARLAKWRTR